MQVAGGETTTCPSGVFVTKVMVQGAKVSISISASQSGMQQQPATPSTTATNQLRISTDDVGVRPSLVNARGARGRDGLAYIGISSHQEIVAIVFIVLGKMAINSDSINEEALHYPVKVGAKGHHFIEARYLTAIYVVVNARDVIVCLLTLLVYYFTPSTNW